MWTISVALPLCPQQWRTKMTFNMLYSLALFSCEAASSNALLWIFRYLAVYFLRADWMLTGQTTRLYLYDTEPNKCSWYHAQKQDLALQRSAVQCQHSLRSRSSKTVAMPSLCSVCGGGKPLWQTVGSVQCCFIQITFKRDVLSVFMYICLPTEFFPEWEN